MEGAHHNEGTNTDPPMTLIERQMQVITTSIQDLAREMTRQNQELWQAIRKEPPTPQQPPNNNQTSLQRENRREDHETDSRQTNPRDREENDVQRTHLSRRHREESTGSLTHPSRHVPTKTARSSRKPDHLGSQTTRLPAVDTGRKSLLLSK